MDNGDMVITQAGHNDAKLLTELGITTFRDTFGPMNRKEDMDIYIEKQMNLATIAAELADKNNIFYIAWANHEAAGYVKLRRAYQPEELVSLNPIEIERLYVRDKYLGKKIGAAMMGHCIAYALAHHHDAIWLGVWEHNYKAIQFYGRWGFVLFGSHPFVLGNDLQTDVLMKKEV